MAYTIRGAYEHEVGDILDFINKLAAYENLQSEVVATEEMLHEWIFARGNAEVIFVIEDDKKVGFALYFHNFSTFLGRSGLYLEDLFVLPEYRGKGYGKAMIETLARTAVERGYGRMEWSCLDWNEPSIAFYKSLGAVAMDEWTVYRLADETLEKVAGVGSFGF